MEAFYALSHLITTQSCRIRQGPVFTASYWHYNWAVSLLSFRKSLSFLFSGIISHILLFNIFSTCLLYPFLFQTVSLIKSFLCLSFCLLCSLFLTSSAVTILSSLLYHFNPPILFLPEFHLRCRHIFISVSNTCLLLIIKRQLWIL